MIIGADVTHPPAPAMGSEQLKPSIAATVAGTSGDNNLFSAEIRVQMGRTEIILDLAEMIYEHLVKFKKSTGGYPESLLCK